MVLKRLDELPGPRGLGAQWSAYRRRLQMGEVFREISQTHGDIARIPIAGVPKVLVSHPDEVRDVLVSKSPYFGLCGQDLLRRVLPWGLIATEGQFHDEHRAIMLLTLRKILSRRVVATTMHRAQQSLSRLTEGSIIDLYQFSREVSLTITASLLFPAEAGDEITSRIDHAAFIDLLSQTNAWFLGMPVPFQKLCLLAGFRRTARMMATRRRVRRQLTEGIATARSLERSGLDADVLSLMTNGSEVGGRMDDEFLSDNLLTLLLAGFETTANSLAWALWEASHQPQLQARIAAEGATISDDPAANVEWNNRAPWTEATIQESLRMYPSVWALARRTLSEFRLGDYLLSKDTWVYTSQWVTHRDPRWFPEPLQFRPARWMKDDSATRALDTTSPPSTERPQFSFFPFGGGKRFCIGQALFDQEASLLLASFFHKFSATPQPNCHPAPKFHVTLQPDRPMLVQLQRRS